MKKLPPSEFESQYVNHVYDEIAPHFDHTRYKPWPGVAKFVNSLPPNTILCDVGCGNGRNLAIRKDIIDFGTDFSMPLCQIAGQSQKNIFHSNALSLQLKDAVVDHVICIAVIHHFSNAERRKKCLQEIARILKPGGTALVTAWATRQPKKEYSESDQMIPWHTDKRFDKDEKTHERFYHFFVEGEFSELVSGIPQLKMINEEWEAGNWNAIFEKQ